MKYKSLQKRTLKSLLCFQLLRQNTRYSNTVPRKKKLNIIIYRLFRVKKFPLFEVLFPFPREWQGPQNKFKSKVNNNNNKKKHHRTCILSRCSDTDFMQTRNHFFFWMLQWGGNREQKWFWATRDNRKWKYLFFLSIYLHASKSVFTKCLYSHHVTRFAWKFGQNHCPRIKQSPLPVGCIAQTFDFVPGFASAPFCGLNGTRKNFILRRAGQPAVGYWWLEVVILFWKGKPPKSNDVVAS